MTLYRSIFFPLLSRLDAETTHEYTLRTLSLAQSMPPGRAFLRRLAGRIDSKTVEIAGIKFPNILGVAAGFDKDVRVAAGLGLLGFGHVEVGTLTPRPQAGNPRPRIFRIPAQEALINRMGFPNCGVRAALPRLQALASRPDRPVLGVSLGKQKDTPLAEAAGDYLDVMSQIYDCADYLAVNISSPNTPGLRELQGGNYLSKLLDTLQSSGYRLARQKGVTPRPLFLKIAPDLTIEELDQILEKGTAFDVAGFIATNTTIRRDQIDGRYRDQAGGLSGRPLAESSNNIIKQIRERGGKSVAIIGVGGVQNYQDVKDKLAAGADLIQLYTGLVYRGPGVAGRLLRRLAAEDHRFNNRW